MTTSRTPETTLLDRPPRRDAVRIHLARLAAGLALAAAIAVPAATGQPGRPDPAAIAGRIPPLPVENGRVELPLGESPAFRWLAIDGGDGVSHPEGALHAGYAITRGVPAGVALILRPGSLAGLRALEIEIRGERPTQLVPTLRDTAGVVYRFPAVAVQPGGPRTHRLSVEELAYFPGQAEAPDPGSFDPAEAILLSLVDIAGFTGALPAGTEVDWTVSRLTGVVGETASAPARARPGAPARPAAAAPTSASDRHPLAVRAEERFFEVLNHRPENRSAALGDLMAAYASDPSDARTTLWLGLNHLWLAAEGDRTDPRVIDEVILSEHFLARAQELDPSERRIPSWLVPARQALARIEGEDEHSQAVEAELLAAYEEDPGFHSFTVALTGFGAPRDSAVFARGLAALRRPDAGCAENDPSCQNRPRWPHNVEAFLTFAADYELKAGERENASAILERVRTLPSYDAWPFRSEAEDRLEHLALYARLYANGDPTDDPPPLVAGGHTCQACHRAE